MKLLKHSLAPKHNPEDCWHKRERKAIIQQLIYKYIYIYIYIGIHNVFIATVTKQKQRQVMLNNG